MSRTPKITRVARRIRDTYSLPLTTAKVIAQALHQRGWLDGDHEAAIRYVVRTDLMHEGTLTVAQADAALEIGSAPIGEPTGIRIGYASDKPVIWDPLATAGSFTGKTGVGKANVALTMALAALDRHPQAQVHYLVDPSLPAPAESVEPLPPRFHLYDTTADPAAAANFTRDVTAELTRRREIVEAGMAFEPLPQLHIMAPGWAVLGLGTTLPAMNTHVSMTVDEPGPDTWTMPNFKEAFKEAFKEIPAPPHRLADQAPPQPSGAVEYRRLILSTVPARYALPGVQVYNGNDADAVAEFTAALRVEVERREAAAAAGGVDTQDQILVLVEGVRIAGHPDLSDLIRRCIPGRLLRIMLVALNDQLGDVVPGASWHRPMAPHELIAGRNGSTERLLESELNRRGETNLEASQPGVNPRIGEMMLNLAGATADNPVSLAEAAKASGADTASIGVPASPDDARVGDAVVVAGGSPACTSAVSPETLDEYAARVLDPERRGPAAAVIRPLLAKMESGIAQLASGDAEGKRRNPLHPQTDHYVEVAADGTFTFSCTAPVGASCREVCANGCEEYHATDCDRTMTDGGECNALFWLNGTGTEIEAYTGELTDPREWTSGPIETWWDSYQEMFLWRFAGEEGDEPSLTPGVARDAGERARDLITRSAAVGAHLLPLVQQGRRPSDRGWSVAPAMPVDDALQHLDAGGNLGVNLARSRFVVLVTQSRLATDAVVDAGFTLTVNTPESPRDDNPRSGGSHTWLRVPEDIDVSTLPADRLGLTLPNGGRIDVLAGNRYVVVPPSRLDGDPEIEYAPCAGGALDPFTPLRQLPVAPRWLFDRSLPAPLGMESLSGVLVPDHHSA